MALQIWRRKMIWDILAKSRDGALILLAVEGLLLGAVPLVALYYVTKGLRQLLPQVRPGLRRAHEALLRVQALVERVMAGLRAPFLWGHGVIAGLRALGSKVRHMLRVGR